MRWFKKISERIKNNSGETIVEVMVSVVIFLLLMAVLQTAITFGTSAQHKSQKMRESNANMFQNLQNTTMTPNGTGTYTFFAYNTDETVKGNEVFTVTAELERKDVSYENADGDGRTAHFYLFGGGE